MINAWWYVVGPALAIFIGAFIASLVYLCSDFFVARKIKKNCPKDGDPALMNPGKPIQLTEKEVEEIDREEFDRHRQFERLRRSANASERPREPIGLRKGTQDELRQRLLSNSDASHYEGVIRNAVDDPGRISEE